MVQICNKCLKEKDISAFYKHKDCVNGIRKTCIECVKNIRIKNLTKEHKNYISRSKIIQKELYLDGKKSCTKCNVIKPLEEFDICRPNAFHRNSHCKECRKQYRKENISRRRTYMNNWEKNKLKTDTDFKLAKLFRRRLREAVKKNIKKTSALTLLGGSIEEAKRYLQQTAINNGYVDFDINNYSGEDYHIDHIIPCSAFNLSCSYHQKLCFHYSNLQILRAKENLLKSDKIIGELNG